MSDPVKAETLITAGSSTADSPAGSPSLTDIVRGILALSQAVEALSGKICSMTTTVDGLRNAVNRIDGEILELKTAIAELQNS